jgi:Big-like domain-containing protein/List-Bact-rpt repeat protein
MEPGGCYREGVSPIKGPWLLRGWRVMRNLICIGLVILLGSCGGGDGGGSITRPPDPAVTPIYKLSIQSGGNGSGVVNGGSLHCVISLGSVPATGCSADLDSGSVVILAAITAGNSTFNGWAGDAGACQSNTSCPLAITGPKSVIATFSLKNTNPPPPPPPAPVATVSINPSTASLRIGETQLLQAETKDAAGNLLTDRTVTWATSAPTIATVDENGVVKGVAAGAASIIATAEGHSGVATVTVTDTTQPPPPPPAAPANVVVVSGTSQIVANRSQVTVHLQNTGGPGTYRLELWGIPHEPNGPDFFFGDTEPVDVPAGYDETLTLEVPGPSQGPINWVLVFTRDQGSAAYRQTDRFDFP